MVLRIYWASAFILPKGVIRKSEKRLRVFLWKEGTTRDYVKVSWREVCKPLSESGEGLRDIATLNRELMFSDNGGSWGWRKLLHLRSLVRPMVDIGNGVIFYLWQDPWHHLGPLIAKFSHGPQLLELGISVKLSSVIVEGQWKWPLIIDIECLEILQLLPQIHGAVDRIIWRYENGRPTSTSLYRSAPPGLKVGWSSLFLGSLKIPKYNFILWLAILRKLSTVDKPWVSYLDACVLCDEGATEMHMHLFFRCGYA
ncbi:UNVERIFIED_CONTAM: hypothetical protein Sindi_0734800 [Sesamum indicum]